MKSATRRRLPAPGTVLGVIALVVALAGTAIAASNLKLGMFEETSRDRLAGTGVIQYAAASHTTPAVVASFNTVHTYSVQCEKSKKATAGGFKWTGTTPDQPDYKILDMYPNGRGFVVRLQLAPVGTALNKPIAVYANCVKSRVQRGAPPT